MVSKRSYRNFSKSTTGTYTSTPKDGLSAKCHSCKPSCAYHFICMVLYICIFCYDHILVENAGPDFWVILNFHTFGWRFKFLTYLTLCTLVGYFIIAFLTDAIPILRLSHCQYFVDWLFTTIVLPFSLIVGFFFWAVYAIDREYVFPSSIDNYLPFHLNHLIVSNTNLI
jgi:hypothetical protein